jgi:hypothetical protein
MSGEGAGKRPLPDRAGLIHLSHVTGWGHGEIMAMPITELADWCREAVDYWNLINAADRSGE